MAATSAPQTPLDPRVEMFQRGTPDPFFNMKALAPRPLSNATDMYDTEFEDSSDIEEGEYSPRISLNSAGRRSETTLSSEEDLPTPKSNNFHGFDFDLNNGRNGNRNSNGSSNNSSAGNAHIITGNTGGRRSVEGPKGPHLFYRTSSGNEEILEIQEGREEDFYLTMSPLTPAFVKTPTTLMSMSRPGTAFKIPPIPQKAPLTSRPISTLTEAVARLDSKEVALWPPKKVADWMYDAGFEPNIVAKFEENDISGAILITLKFEDLRELDIQSFGQRHKLWAEIHNLRGDANARPPSPTVIDCDSDTDPDSNGRRRRKTSKHRKHKKPGFDDIISPLESVSIVGIEQLMPKPHKCAKGEKCSKWRKQQRIIAEFNKEHPSGQFGMAHPVSPKGGRILIAGDPGNPYTAEAARPFSDAQPSVVASSDVLGPGSLPPFAPTKVDEAALANILTRDPQDNVRQFLNFQHVDPSWGTEEPATPPYEMFPTLPPTPAFPPPHQNLRLNLPRLAIPNGPSASNANRNPAYQGALPPRSASANAFSPGPMHRAEALSPELRNAPPVSFNNRSFQQPQYQQPYRYGTPASELDVSVPVTLQNLGPIARDASQSVPPNMNYRPPVPLVSLQRSGSRSSRRPSYLPRLDENLAAGVVPPRPSALFSTASRSPVKGPSENRNAEETHSGWMKKRKTKLLRHEWTDVHATLTGTKLDMHSSDAPASKVIESIDVEDYNIACSSAASTSKLNSALKAMSLTHGKKDEISAFNFQLVPEIKKDANGRIMPGQGRDGKVRKRESLMNGGGKVLKLETHHFAVKGREDRIDWMRELMLAKALGKRGDGFEVQVNGVGGCGGNMI